MYHFCQMTSSAQIPVFERRVEVRSRTEACPALLSDLYRECFPVTVLNISPSGVGVKVAAKLAVDFPVLLELNGRLILGNVRHCVRASDGAGYILGIKIQRIVNTARHEVAM